MTAQEQINTVKNVTWLGAILNILLSIAKLVVGYLCGSQTLIADGIHSFSDLISDLLVLIGANYWSAPPDSDHPYGHARIEAAATVGIGILLSIAALFIGHNALESLDHPTPMQIGFWPITVVILAIIVKEALYWITLLAAKRIKSSALQANAWHHRSDALSSIPALIALVITAFKPSWYYADAVGALIVSCMLIYVAGKIIFGAFDDLVDKCPPNICSQIIDFTKEIAGVENAHALRARKFGTGLLVDLHLEVSPDMTVKEAHDITTKVETHIMQKLPDVLEVIIHVEPTGEG